MAGQPPVSPEEVRGILFVIGDINVNVERILRLLEDALEEEGPEEDA